MNTKRSFRALPTLMLALGILFLLPLSFFIGRSLRDQESVTAAQSASTGTPAPGAGAALVNPPHPVQDFQLSDQQGNPMRLSDLRGRPVLLFFGYTHCPDECPATLANFLRIERALGGDAENVAFVFISVDPQRDTPQVIADYLANFSDQFIGLRGEEPVLSQIAPDYMLAFESEGVQIDLEHDHADATEAAHDHETDGEDPHAEENYLIQHSSPAFLIDKNGYLRLLFFANTDVEVMVQGVQQVMALPDEALINALMPTSPPLLMPTFTPAPTETGDAEVTETADAALLDGDPARGAELFRTFQPKVGTVCTTCHLVDSDERLVGPGLLTLAERAASRVPGQSAADYIRSSILDPGEYVVEGYADIMPKNWDSAFDEQAISDLLAYLLTLEE